MAVVALAQFCAHASGADTQAISADTPDIEFERALCIGLAAEVEHASDAQHIDRRAVPLELRVKGSDDADRQSRIACLLGSLERAGFAARIADDDAASRAMPIINRDVLTVNIAVPDRPFSDSVRVKFTVARTQSEMSRSWAHPGYIDFHERGGTWSNDAAKITRFIN
jgi:hypothetical protein